MSDSILSHSTHARNGRDDKSPQISPAQALAVAARACQSLLTGQPKPFTFSKEELEQAMIVCCDLACEAKQGDDK